MDSLTDPVAGESLFINRELSWLEFNRRVLEEAKDDSVPLLERIKFLAIFSSNLDEFFMVRVARLMRRVHDGDRRPGPDGLTPAETLTAMAKLAHELVDEQHQCFLDTILPRLTYEGIYLCRPKEMTAEQGRFLEDYFLGTLYPIVTPLAIDPGHPFPYLANRSLCLVVSLRAAIASRLPHTDLSIVHIPTHVAPRFIALPTVEGQHAFVLLEDVLRHYLPRLYQGFEILSCHAIRVTRDADFGLTRRRDEDLMMLIEKGIRKRRMGDAVRLQYDRDMPMAIVNQLVDELDLSPASLYPGEGFTAFTDLLQLYNALNIPRLRDRPQPPLPVPSFEHAADLWSAIRARDVLVFHPYQSFDTVTRFVDEAASDPKVLAIKMTLYRVSPTSPIAPALRRAAEAGKEVSVLVELQARFDEEANITWARALEDVGAHVVYGMVGYKTHCKICLVVRQEADGIRRYCHLATGNYNVRTAGVYSDLGLFTCRESFAQDLTELFNLLTGYTRPQKFNHILLAPLGLREHFINCIRGEADHARAGRPARIIAKVNSLIDPAIIDELYRASQAGVQIDLIVRGMCSLRPRLVGVSEHIEVVSIIDRYLEHARVFYFHDDNDPKYWLASADWMERNFDRRLEIAFPVLDLQHQARLKEILEVQLSDCLKSWRLQPDGTWRRSPPCGTRLVRSQEKLYELTRSAANGSVTPS
ncbi:MAG: polyphosphate kinase 1 [Deltaproteobacteria bacterium]|nr:polyphosphate kinase 1 [Deltaproteobacteria bacterium]